MKNRYKLIFILGLVLILASFIAYGVQASKYYFPAGTSDEEILRLTQERGLNESMAVQYGVFLGLFLPGVILLGIYGIGGLPKPVFEHTLMTKAFMILMLITNILICIIYLLRAPAATNVLMASWWLVMILPILGLANFLFVLAVWNGRKWGIYGFSAATLVTFILNIIVGGMPFFTALFLFSTAVVLIWLIWPVVWQMN